MDKLSIIEITISEVHEAMLEGRISCRQLIEECLKQIDAYDKKGPCINAIVQINPKALEIADMLDKKLQESGKLTGTMHGIPVLIKDNINTFDMETTAGSASLKGYIPKKDAYIVSKLREEGAVILAKTNLHEFAIWGESISSILGQTLNPYDLTRTPGGSSGGTGAAIACNMGIVGIGTDTINSVRNPSSACNLVGIRPTQGLVSRNGIVPYSLTQDIAGPMCRTVEDAVRTLDVIAGYDKEDAQTALSVTRRPESYVYSLKKDGIKNKRIGVLKSFFGTKDENQGVNGRILEAIEILKEEGATVVEIEEEIDSAWLTQNVSVHLDDFKTHLEKYLSLTEPEPPVHSIQEILDSGAYHPGVEENMKKALTLSVGTPEYNKKLLRHLDIKTMLLKIMADYGIDAIVYPHQQQLVCETGGMQKQRNGVLCSVTGFPSIVVPVGFVESADAPIGVPVGMEIVGRPFCEPTLIEIAYGFEAVTDFRKIPELC